ncbi:hypothetical protein ElyMa_005857300 [Elysia marginata]|uniref:Uncharacterized protein n=1 Tax=Elysia marginata TaxID=1093978 RepID=A0AAV4G041_9GAST|nr:hypothetical protein ElyMa_005857300 [Elysia marginata]
MDRSRWKWASKPSPSSSGSTGPRLSWRDKEAPDANLSRSSLYLFLEAPDTSCLDSLSLPKETLRVFLGTPAGCGPPHGRRCTEPTGMCFGCGIAWNSSLVSGRLWL